MAEQTQLRYGQREKRQLETIIRRVQNVVDISFVFTENDELEVSGLEGEATLSFYHPRSAVAFFDGFLMGYSLGLDVPDETTEEERMDL